jgi:hypothetical protein
MALPPGVTLGDGKCPNCGCEGVKIKTTAAARPIAYTNCKPEHEGGCNTQLFARSAKGSEALIGRISKWYPGMREKVLGKAPSPPTDTSADEHESSAAKSPRRPRARPPAGKGKPAAKDRTPKPPAEPKPKSLLSRFLDIDLTK